MPLTDDTIEAIADALWTSRTERQAIAPIQPQHPEMTIDEAYAINLRLTERRVASGDGIVGKKIGLTSVAVQSMLGVDQPDFGFLFESMRSDGEMAISKALIAPKAEGELAFIMGSDLPPGTITAEQIIAATESVAPCFEVIDSRIADWKITIQDTVADNASCGLFALGSAVPIDGLDLPNLKMELTKNGEPLSEGVGSNALESPVNCVVWLANALREYGVELQAGDIVLSGSWVPLEPVRAGDTMGLTIHGVGSCELTFT